MCVVHQRASLNRGIMSRTFNTYPYWVLLLKYGVIKHNHAFGYCKIEEPASWGSHKPWEHINTCPRYRVEDISCDGVNCKTYYFLLESFNYFDAMDRVDKRCNQPHVKYVLLENVECAVCEILVPYCHYVIPNNYPGWRAYTSSPPRWWRKHTEHAVARGYKRAKLGEFKKSANGISKNDYDYDDLDWEVPKKFSKGYWD